MMDRRQYNILHRYFKFHNNLMSQYVGLSIVIDYSTAMA